jgi:hypothetical protein
VLQLKKGWFVMSKLRVALQFLCLIVCLLCCTGCGGGGGSDGGRGIEGTGFKTLVRGSVLDQKGAAVSGADITTDDAATRTDTKGSFSLETKIDLNEQVRIDVETNGTSGSIIMAPIEPNPENAVEITVKADSDNGTITLEDQKTVPKIPTSTELEESDNELIDELDNIDDEFEEEDDNPINPFNPDLVGLL